MDQKLTKNVVLPRKLRRTEVINQEFKKNFITLISQSCKKQVPAKNKVMQETLCKRWRKEEPVKANKNKVTPSSPTSTSETDQASETH